MEEKRFLLSNYDLTPLQCQGFQADKFVERCLNIPETIPEQTSASSDEDNLKMDASKDLTECFSSNKQNIASNNSVMSDESTVCAIKPFSSSHIMKCEKKLLESSNDDESTFELNEKPVNSEKLLQLTKNLKFLNETISTPPSALREQISMLRKEMNEAYEFHDLEIQILNEERKQDPESSEQLIEKYSTLLELYTSLKNEYEEYRREQEKIRNELQSKTVDCLESLCSQIETSDNSLSSSSFVSFNTDFKCSTMIGNFTEKETVLLHDATFQTKDPLSDTNMFKTPKYTPYKSAKKLFPQNLNRKSDRYDSEYNVKLGEVETALHDKAKEVEKLEQRLFKIEDLSELLQNEFERISTLLKENETLKKNLTNKSEELDTLTQKLFTEIISLNPSLMDSLVDTPGTKLLPVLVETIMERFRNVEDTLMMKFNTEKSEWEMKVADLMEENKRLNNQISEITNFQDLKTSYENRLLNAESKMQIQAEEIQILKTHDSSTRQLNEDVICAKAEVTRLETQLSLADNHKKEMEERYCALEETSNNLRLDLEKIKEMNEIIQNENNKLKEHLTEATTEKIDLQDVCEQLGRQLSEYKEIISRDKEILSLKNQEMEQMKTNLTEANEVILKMKAEFFLTESEKLNFERRSLELENTIAALQTVIITKDTILKDLEGMKSSCENELQNTKQELKEKEVLISDLKTELNTVEQKCFTAVEETERLKEQLNTQTSSFLELEKSYKDLEKKLLNLENTILTRDEEIQILKTQDSNTEQMAEDLALAKVEITRLEAQLSYADNHKKEMEERYRVLEETNNNLRLDLEKIKEVCETIQNEKGAVLKDLEDVKSCCESELENLKQQIKEKEELISDLSTELNTVEQKCFTAVEETERLKEQLNTQTSSFLELEKSYKDLEKKLLDVENTLLTRDEELQILKTHDSNTKQLNEDLTQAEAEVKKLETQLSLADNHKKEVEERYRVLEETSTNLRLDLEKIKEMYEVIQNENNKLKECLAETSTEKRDLQDVCEQLGRQLAECKAIISSREEEILSLRNREMEQMRSDLAEANAVVLKVKAELFTMNEKVAVTESEKLNFEKKCFELENMNVTLRNTITTKDTILKDLEDFKSCCESELCNIKQQLQENEVIISDLKAELSTVKEKYFTEVEKAERLNEDVNSQTSAFMELEKSYKKLENEILDGENKMQKQKEEINMLIQTHDFNIRQMGEDLTLAKTEVTRLETQLSYADNYKKEMEERYRVLEETNNNLRLDLEKLKEVCETIQNEKGAVLKDLEDVKSCCESELENLKQQIKEKEELISDLSTELDTVKQKCISEVEKAERLNEQLNTETSAFIELEKTYKNVESKLLDAENKIQTQREEINMLIKTHDFNIGQMGEDLALAKAEVTRLETEYSLADNHKKEMEERYRVLEETSNNLRLDLEKIKEMYEVIQNENNKLKECLTETSTEKRDLQDVCEQLGRQLAECKAIISSRDEEILSLRNREMEQMRSDLAEANAVVLKVKAELFTMNEKVAVTESEKLNFEKKCFELENMNVTLRNTIITKDTILKDLEDFKSCCESELCNIKQQLQENEVIISDLKAELSTVKEKYFTEVEKAERLNEEMNSQKSAFTELGKSYKDVERKLLNAENKIHMKEKEIRLLQSHGTNIELTEDDFASVEGLEKLKLSSVKDFPPLMKKVMVQVKKFQSRAAELKEENEKLDEECDSYAKVIKDLKKEAAMEWKKNNEKTQALEDKILRLTEIKDDLELEKKDLLSKISKLEEECQRLKANILPEGRNCCCGVDLKKVNELKRIILVKEQKLLELQDLEVQNNSYKSQIEYLKNALDKERKKIIEEREKNKKLQNELSEKNQNQKTESKKFEENQILEELRMRGSISGGVVQEIVDKEKMRKLSKDVGVLKEICRARYAEIKRLEAENAALKNVTPKNSNQMDSPLRTRGYNLRSKTQVVEKWRTEMGGKENKAT